MADIFNPPNARINSLDIRYAATESIEENLASEFVSHIVKEIREYNAMLDEAHEAGVRLVNFGQTVTFHLENKLCEPLSHLLFRYNRYRRPSEIDSACQPD